MISSVGTELMEEAVRVSELINTRIAICIPSVLSEGEAFSAGISITCSSGLPCRNFSGRLVFQGSLGIKGLPKSINFTEGEACMRIEGLEANGAEVAVIRGIMEDSGIRGDAPRISSNPAWVFKEPPFRIFWGDMHFHTRYSDCSGWRCLDPEWGYAYARDVSFLDFAAAADHLRGIKAKPERWPRLQQLARRYNDPGRFAAFLAFESSHATGWGGDNNVYFLDDDAPHFWLERDDMRTNSPEVRLEELWEQLDASRKPYFSVPHHTGRADKYRAWDDACHDPERETLFEIYSSWGSSEMKNSRFPGAQGNADEKAYFTDALKAGSRFGVIASSDDHATLPGSVHHFRVDPFLPPYQKGYAHKGLAAVKAGELTRGKLFDSMRNRSAYATTDSRALIDIHVGDAAMGSEITADSLLRKKRLIDVLYTSDRASSAVFTLMRNGDPVSRQSLQGGDLSSRMNRIRFEDGEELESVSIRDSLYSPAPFTVYYVSIEDSTGAQQWTSPVWISP